METKNSIKVNYKKQLINFFVISKIKKFFYKVFIYHCLSIFTKY